MANYCPNCGQCVGDGAAYCSACGTALNGNATASAANGNSAASTAGTVLGTLVAVNLIGGLTRQLYFYNGRYFLDPYCRRPFGSPHMIVGRHRPIGMRPMPPHGGIPGPRGPMRPRGDFHGGPPGGRPGGPHGGRR